MSRLPRRLQPLWPVAKRLHRWATGLLGVVFRRTSRLSGRRALPARATDPVRRHRGARPVARDHAPGRTGRGAGPVDAGRRTGRARGVRAVAPAYRLGAVRAGGARRVAGRRLRRDGRARRPVLDYETSGYFGISGWREHPLFLRPRLPSPTSVPGTLLSLATRGTSTNYYHFLLDLLPRWGIFEEALPDTAVDAVYLGTRASYQRQLLELVGLGDLPVVEVDKHACLAPERLLVPSTPNQDLMAPHWVVDWLRTSPAGVAGPERLQPRPLRHPRARCQHPALRRRARAVAGARGARLHPPRPRLGLGPRADRLVRGSRGDRRPARRGPGQPGLRPTRRPRARAVRTRLREPLLLGHHRRRPRRPLPLPRRRHPRRDHHRRTPPHDRRTPRHLHPPGPRPHRSGPPLLTD